MTHDTFRELVYSYYQPDGRGMPWRADTQPYYIVVSELMLQQTQVSRVIPKFQEFIARFPDFHALAEADFRDVLVLWSGLGYSRRARFLHQIAQRVVAKFDGELPRDRALLETLPGIGPGTSGAIMAYAFNAPEAYIETNIRSIYIHHFFPSQDHVDDKQILKVIESTLDTTQPRIWYWALMDYGAHLKKTIKNPSRKSKHYKKQSRFEGSARQLRSRILQRIVDIPMTEQDLMQDFNDDRVAGLLSDLVRDNMVKKKTDDTYTIAS